MHRRCVAQVAPAAIAALVVMSFVGLGGCRRAPTDAATTDTTDLAPGSVRDEIGRVVTPRALPARRVVSLAPNITELMFAVGAGAQLVGVDKYSDQPAPEVDRLPRVGSNYEPSLERIAGLAPDLVFLSKSANKRETAEALERMGIPTFLTETPGLAEMGRTLRDVGRYPQTLKFLIAYLLYNDAIQTVLAQAGVFATEELKMPLSSLALAVLVSQAIGVFGATGFNQLARLITAKRAVLCSVVAFTAVLIYTYLAVDTPLQFFVLAGLVGLVMGGSQALSRSIFAQLIPHGKEAEYFGLYEISDKGTSWLGPIVFGLAYQFTMSYRFAILSLIVFLAAGFAMLVRVNVEQGTRDIAV